MRPSLPSHKYYSCLFIFLLGWLILAGCARDEPVLPATPTKLATTVAPNVTATGSNQAIPSATPTASPSLQPRDETLISSTPTPNPKPLITYTPWELVHDLSWSPDGRRLAISAGDWVHVYDAPPLAELHTLYIGDWVVDLDYLLSNQLAMASKNGLLQFWETDTGSLLCRMQAHNKGANSLDFDLSHRMLASTGNDAILRIWDLTPLIENSIPPSGEEGCGLNLLAEMIGGAFAVPAVRFSPDGSLVASIDLQVVRLRDPGTQLLVHSLRAENSLFDIAFSPDGRRIATAELGNRVRIWNVSSGEVLQTLEQNASLTQFIWRIAFSPDGEIMAAGSSDGTILLWDATSGELLQALPAHMRPVTALEFSPDGHWLASGSLDASVKLWEVGK